MFQREGGEPVVSKCQDLGCPFFSHFMKWNWRPLSLKCWHFEASEDIMIKFKSQGLYIIRIKYWNASGSGPLPSLIPTLWNICILHYKQAKLPKDMQHSVHVKYICISHIPFKSYIFFKTSMFLGCAQLQEASPTCNFSRHLVKYQILIVYNLYFLHSKYFWKHWPLFIPPMYLIVWWNITKGQLTSKRLFDLFNSPKKQTKNFCPSRLGQNFEFSRSFFGRIGDTKKMFWN